MTKLKTTTQKEIHSILMAGIIDVDADVDVYSKYILFYGHLFVPIYRVKQNIFEEL